MHITNFEITPFDKNMQVEESDTPIDLFVLPKNMSLHHNQPSVNIFQIVSYPQPNVVHSPRSKLKAKKKPSPMALDKLQKVVDSVLKYQFYIDTSVSDQFITPLREAWLTKATRYVGRHSRHMVTPEVYHNTMIAVAGEINKVYKQSMRQAIVEYVLKVQNICYINEYYTRIIIEFSF